MQRECIEARYRQRTLHLAAAAEGCDRCSLGRAGAWKQLLCCIAQRSDARLREDAVYERIAVLAPTADLRRR